MFLKYDLIYVQGKNIVTPLDNHDEFPLISIVITCYNKSRYIKQAIASATNQSYPNVEVIVVDDFSTDNSVAVIDEALANTPQVKVIKHTENHGVAAARDNGLKASHGSYIVVLDGDDYLSTMALESLYLYHINNPHFDIIYSNYIYVDDSGKRVGESSIANNTFTTEGDMLPALIPGGIIPVTALIPKSVIIALGGYSFESRTGNVQRGHEDYFLYLRAALTGYQFGFLDIPTFFYRRTDQSLSNNRQRANAGRYEALRYSLEYYPDQIGNGLTEIISKLLAYKSSIVHKNQQLTDVQKLLDQKEQAIIDISGQYEQEYHKAVDLYKQLTAEHDKAVELHQVLQEEQQKLMAVNNELDAERHHANTLQYELEQEKNTIHQLVTQITQKEHELQNQQQSYASALDAQKAYYEEQMTAIADMTARELQQLDLEIQQVLIELNHQNEQLIQAHVAQLNAIKTDNQNLRANIEAITSTRSWKFINSWWQLKSILTLQFLLPQRTRGLFGTAFYILRHEGPFKLISQTLRWLRGERHYYRQYIATRQNTGVEFYANIENKKSVVFTGKGTILQVRGWCYHADQSIKQIDIFVGQKRHKARHINLPRVDVLQYAIQNSRVGNHTLNSGFLAEIPTKDLSQNQQIPMVLTATLENGHQVHHKLQPVELQLQPTSDISQAKVAKADNTEPLIAICMTTYNPDMRFFEKQIKSIQTQEHPHWICIISDDHSSPEHFEQIKAIVDNDKRFFVYRNAKNLGFYHNFEHCLRYVPNEADFVALCDQDDVWYPQKLSTKLAQFTSPDVMLVYSDMHLIDQDDQVISQTYWTHRHNQYTNLEQLILSNTVTGAASLFRRDVLDYLLPFPEKSVFSFHDHWLGATALTLGQIQYVAQSLYGYRQHSSNIIGYYAPPDTQFTKQLAKVVLWRWQGQKRAEVTSDIWIYYRDYFNLLYNITLMARVLLQRVSETEIGRDKYKMLQSVAKLDHSLSGLVRLVRRYIHKQKYVLARDQYILLGYLAKNRVQHYSEHNQQDVEHVLMTTISTTNNASQATNKQATKSQRIPDAWLQSVGMMNYLTPKIAPLQLDIRNNEATRVNIIVSEVNFKYFFGGYYAVFHLAQKLSRVGRRARVVLVDENNFNLEHWRQEIQKYVGLETFFDEVEVSYHFNRTRALTCSPQDQFIPTSWWTAHIAHKATQMIGAKQRFVYLTQDFEPIFYPGGSLYALANESYNFPHYALYSTPFLQEYAQRNHIGPFQDGEEAGFANSVAFQNAILAKAASIDNIKQRQGYRLLFYARPESHASRNAFELGMLALKQAISSGYFDVDQWEFHGIGASYSGPNLPLGHGKSLSMLAKLPLQEYYDHITQYDVGLSLMMSPHPSLMPMDLAAAGAISVTNTFLNKTTDKMQRISSNIIAVSPTIEGLSIALKVAAQRAQDIEGRIAGTQLNWATDWDEAYNPNIIAKINNWLENGG